MNNVGFKNKPNLRKKQGKNLFQKMRFCVSPQKIVGIHSRAEVVKRFKDPEIACQQAASGKPAKFANHVHYK